VGRGYRYNYVWGCGIKETQSIHGIRDCFVGFYRARVDPSQVITAGAERAAVLGQRRGWLASGVQSRGDNGKIKRKCHSSA